MSRALNHHAGAYLVNSGYGAFPIFCSTTKFYDYGMDNSDSNTGVDDYYILLPGYKLLLYINNGASESSSYLIDNTYGTTILYQTSPSVNEMSSCKLFFEENEITSVLNYAQ
jgi:hypothetical protein